MLCTTSPTVLNSLDGRLTLNFRPTSNPPPYDPDQYNLVIVWDILMQDYRSVNMSYCNLIAKIPANKSFWDYFTKEILPKSSNEKKYWMDI
jgi:hypothetical protein